MRRTIRNCRRDREGADFSIQRINSSPRAATADPHNPLSLPKISALHPHACKTSTSFAALHHFTRASPRVATFLSLARRLQFSLMTERRQWFGKRMFMMASKTNCRDARIDFMRGIALMTIFIDHLPDNLLGLFTIRNYGYSDASEIFVLLAGYSSMLAYGRCFARDGFVAGLRKVALRCAHLYVAQAALLLFTLVVIGAWLRHFDVDLDSLSVFIQTGAKGLERGLLLKAQPSSLNILPLYIVLLASFPAFLALIRTSKILALFLSGSLWLSANLMPELNLTNWLNGGGWYFNPFAWQFLFMLGMAAADIGAANNGNLPASPWLRLPAWAYAIFALIVAAPWVSWGLSDTVLLTTSDPDKSVLAPYRLLNVLAIAVLTLGSTRFREFAGAKFAFCIVACGRNSLEVFAAGTALSIAP
jgi:hypothetical protein